MSDNILSLFPSYHIYVCNAVKGARFGRAMVGILVFVRKQYKGLVSLVENINYKFGVFLKCSKILFDTDKDVILSFIYLPPLGSPLYKNMERHGIDLLEDLYLQLPIYDKYHIIMGDLNSRTGVLNDFFSNKKNVKEFEEYENIFDTFSFSIQRASRNKVIMSLGRHSIEFCKIYGLYIVNGKIGQGKNIESYTYIGSQGCSVIDYVLSSADLFAKFKNFSIDTRTDSPHLPMTLIISTEVAVLQEHDKAINDTAMFSRNPDDIDHFVKSLSELNQTNFFHD